MTKDEAKKLIKIELDGIANTQSEYDDGWWETSTGAEFGKERLNKVLKIIEALEQPTTTYEQPQGWMQQLVSETDGKKTIRYTFTKTRIGKNDIPIYFQETLEQPSWKELSHDEIGNCFDEVMIVDEISSEFTPINFARAIEAKLKEKNHGTPN